MFFRRRDVLSPAARSIKTFGLDENFIREKLKDVAARLDILSHPKGVDIRITAGGETPSESVKLLDAIETKIRNRLGDSVFGVDNEKMEEALGRIMEASGSTVAVAESCTGGLICHWITNVPGSSRYFKQGFIVYSDHAKTDSLGIDKKILHDFGAVSSQAVEEMAKRARHIAGTNTAIAVSGIAGPAGGAENKPVGTVYICIIANGTMKTEKFQFKGWRELVKIQAAQTALDMLRRNLK